MKLEKEMLFVKIKKKHMMDSVGGMDEFMTKLQTCFDRFARHLIHFKFGSDLY